MRLEPLEFSEISGWSADEAAAAWPAFLASCEAIVAARKPLRTGIDPDPSHVEICRKALALRGDPDLVESFFRAQFQPCRVRPGVEGQSGFVTGYYEPEVIGSLVPSSDFRAPVLARPADLIDMRGVRVPGWDPTCEGARRTANGRLEPYPDRRQIEAGGIEAVPIVWLEDHVEVFLVQVQGSARVRLPDGRCMRLTYDGRNGRPYTSIGRALIESGAISQDEMSLTRLKGWLKAHGLEPGQPAREVMHLNQSYVFFRGDMDAAEGVGPVGGQGVPLSPRRSIAVDRRIWPYGAPVWIAADLRSAGLDAAPSAMLMVAQDTGSAIVGPARGDLFIGSGSTAGEIAGKIRHQADFVVLLPRGSRDAS